MWGSFPQENPYCRVGNKRFHNSLSSLSLSFFSFKTSRVVVRGGGGGEWENLEILPKHREFCMHKL